MSAPAPGTDGAHITYCRLCEAQCGLIATVAGGRITEVGPDRAHPGSQGHLCAKGPRMVDVVYDPDRVTTPLKRTGGPGEFAPVSWDEALDAIAARLRAICDSHGGDAVGLYVGNPASFATFHAMSTAALQTALGGGKMFNGVHVDTGAKMLAAELLYGNPTRYTFPDLERCDFLLMLGANPLVSHMSLVAEPRAREKLDGIAGRGAVVVADPRRTETARRYEHLAVRPDSDAWLLAGLLATVFREGLHRPGALARTDGWRELAAALEGFSLDHASLRCGVPTETIRGLARRFAMARTAACYGRVGTNRGSFSTLANLLIEALNLVTGRFGAQGGWVIGQPPLGNAPRRGSPVPYGSKRSRIGGLPMVLGATPGGSLADEILTPGEGQMRALIVDSGNPVMAYPRGDRTAAALEELELMVSIDLYLTETSRHAHYVLPATTFFERADVTYYWSANAPRPWLQASDAVIAPVGEARTEHAIYDALLSRLGRRGAFATPGAPDARPGPIDQADGVLRGGRHRENGAAMSIARLREEFPSGWQFLANVDAAASWDMVDHADRRVQLWSETFAAELERLLAAPADGSALRLFGRRKLKSLNSWMHNAERLVRGDRPTLLIHPADAAPRGIGDGEAVRVTSKAGEVEIVAEVSDEVMPGSVCYPHGWGHVGGWRHAAALPGANINLLASDDPADWEQVSGMVMLDGISVEVRAVDRRTRQAASPTGSGSSNW